jgi:hypothetical protein
MLELLAAPMDYAAYAIHDKGLVSNESLVRGRTFPGINVAPGTAQNPFSSAC